MKVQWISISAISSIVIILCTFFSEIGNANGFSVNLVQFSDSTIFSGTHCSTLSSQTTIQDNGCNLLSFGGNYYYVKVDCVSNTLTSAWTIGIYTQSDYQCSLDTANYLILSGTFAGDGCASASKAAYNLHQQFIVRCDGVVLAPTMAPTAAPSVSPPTRTPTAAPSTLAPSYPPQLSYAAAVTSYGRYANCSQQAGRVLVSEVFDSGSVLSMGNCSSISLMVTTNSSSATALYRTTAYRAIVHCFSSSEWTMSVYNVSQTQMCSPSNLVLKTNHSLFSSSLSCFRTDIVDPIYSSLTFQVSCSPRYRSPSPTLLPSTAPTAVPSTRNPTTATPSLSLRPSTSAPSYVASRLTRIRWYISTLSSLSISASTARRLTTPADHSYHNVHYYTDDGRRVHSPMAAEDGLRMHSPMAAADSTAITATEVDTTTMCQSSTMAVASFQVPKETCLTSSALSAAFSTFDFDYSGIDSSLVTNASRIVQNVTDTFRAHLGSLSIRCGAGNVGGVVYEWRATLYTASSCFSGGTSDVYSFYGGSTCACSAFTSVSSSRTSGVVDKTLLMLLSSTALQVDCDQSSPTDCDNVAHFDDDSPANVQSASSLTQYYNSSPALFIGLTILFVVILLVLVLFAVRRYCEPAGIESSCYVSCDVPYCTSAYDLYISQFELTCWRPMVRFGHSIYLGARHWGQFLYFVCWSRNGHRLAAHISSRSNNDNDNNNNNDNNNTASSGAAGAASMAVAELVSRLVDRGDVTVEEVAMWNIEPLVIPNAQPLPQFLRRQQQRHASTPIATMATTTSTSSYSSRSAPMTTAVVSRPGQSVELTTPLAMASEADMLWDLDAARSVSWQILYAETACTSEQPQQLQQQDVSRHSRRAHQIGSQLNTWIRSVCRFLPHGFSAPIYSEASAATGTYSTQQMLFAASTASGIRPSTNSLSLDEQQNHIPVVSVSARLSLLPTSADAQTMNLDAVNSTEALLMMQQTQQPGHLFLNFAASFANLPFVSSWRIVPSHTLSSTSATAALDANRDFTAAPAPEREHQDEYNDDDDVVHAYDEHLDDIEAVGSTRPISDLHYDATNATTDYNYDHAGAYDSNEVPHQPQQPEEDHGEDNAWGLWYLNREDRADLADDFPLAEHPYDTTENGYYAEEPDYPNQEEGEEEKEEEEHPQEANVGNADEEEEDEHSYHHYLQSAV